MNIMDYACKCLTLHYLAFVHLILLQMPGKIYLFPEVVICAHPAAKVTTPHFASHMSLMSNVVWWAMYLARIGMLFYY